MSASPNFHFDGSITLEAYRVQWPAKLAQLEKDLKALKAYDGVPTAGDWGMRLDSLECEISNACDTGGHFKDVHPDKGFRDEGAKADDAFENLSLELEKDPGMAALVQKMTFVDPSADPHEKIFVERWQTIFQRSGATLPDVKRSELSTLDKVLTDLRTQFSRNINDGDNHFKVALSDLDGMPEDFLKSHPADDNGQVTLTTRHADYFPIQSFCKSDDVRRQMQLSYRQRCPQNIEVLQQIIEGCQTQAEILGYPNYAELACQGRQTLKGLSNVTKFIDDVKTIATPLANQEKRALAKAYGTDDLKVWQAAFAKEILLRKLFAGFDSSQVRPYLRVQNVLPQISLLMQELFDVRFVQRSDVKTWCESGIECYDVYDDARDQPLGRLYIDVGAETD